MTTPSVPLLTIESARENLRVGRTTLYRLISEGEIEVVKIGRCVRIPADSLAQFIDRQRNAAQQGALA